MQPEVYFFGQRFATGVLVKGDGLLQGIHENKAGMAIFHVTFQVLTEHRIQLAVDVFGKLLQDIFALHNFPSFTIAVILKFFSADSPEPFRWLPRSLQNAFLWK
jgi:hypothetical protein